MDNSLTSCLGYFIYLTRTVVKRSDSVLLFIYSSTRRRDNYKSQPSIYFEAFIFRALLVQSVINLESSGQKTLEKTEGAAKRDNLETWAILDSSPRTMTHNTK